MNIVVIGSGSGLGREIVNILKEKHNVISFSSKNAEGENLNFIDLNNFSQEDFESKLLNIKNIDELYYLSNLSEYKKFDSIDQEKFQKFINFNFLNFCLLVQSVLKVNRKIHLKIILSHINFMYNRGFSLYKAQKIFQKNLLDNLQIEFPEIKVSYFYPGAMDTDFVKNNNYTGLSLFKKQSPHLVAKKIINNNSYSKFSDLIIHLIYKIIPSSFLIRAYKKLFKYFER